MNGTPKPTVIDGRIVLLPLSAREVEAIVGGTKSVIDLDNLRTVNAAAREAEYWADEAAAELEDER